MTATPSNAPSLSEFSRLSGVFFSPGETFPDIARRPRWWIPLAIIVLMALVVSAVYSQRVGWDRLMRQQLAQSSRGQSMTAEQLDRAVATSAKVAGVMGYVGPLVALPVSMVVVAGVLLFLVNTLFGGDLRFPSMLGIVTHSFLPSVIGSVLTLVVMFLKEPQDFDLSNAVMLNVGAFMPDGTSRWLVSLLGSLDFFSFWTMALMAIGISAASPRISVGKAAVAVVVPWAIYVGIKAALSGIFQ